MSIDDYSEAEYCIEGIDCLEWIKENLKLYSVYTISEKFIKETFEKNGKIYIFKKWHNDKSKKYIIFLCYSKKSNQAFFCLLTTQKGCVNSKEKNPQTNKNNKINSIECKVCQEDKCFQKCHSFPIKNYLNFSGEEWICCRNNCNQLCKTICSKNHPKQKCFERVWIYKNKMLDKDIYLESNNIFIIDLNYLTDSMFYHNVSFEKVEGIEEFDEYYKHLIVNHINDDNWNILSKNSTLDIYKKLPPSKNEKCLYWKYKMKKYQN